MHLFTVFTSTTLSIHLVEIRNPTDALLSLHPYQKNLYLDTPLPITPAPNPVNLVFFCTQRTSIFLLCNVSTTSADLPDIVPMFQVANLMQSRTLEVFFRPPLPASLQNIRSVTLITMGTPSCSLAWFPTILFRRWQMGLPTWYYGLYPAHFFCVSC